MQRPQVLIERPKFKLLKSISIVTDANRCISTSVASLVRSGRQFKFTIQVRNVEKEIVAD